MLENTPNVYFILMINVMWFYMLDMIIWEWYSMIWYVMQKEEQGDFYHIQSIQEDWNICWMIENQCLYNLEINVVIYLWLIVKDCKVSKWSYEIDQLYRK